MKKAQIIEALQKFISQRSGISFADYGERESFMGDYRPILKAGRHARQLLREVALRESITAENIIEASNRAFMGRLQFETRPDGSVRVDYTTGQYFPTEYRNAACAVLARALWAFWAADCETGADIRKIARRELGRAIASDWFN